MGYRVEYNTVNNPVFQEDEKVFAVQCMAQMHAEALLGSSRAIKDFKVVFVDEDPSYDARNFRRVEQRTKVDQYFSPEPLPSLPKPPEDPPLSSIMSAAW